MPAAAATPDLAAPVTDYIDVVTPEGRIAWANEAESGALGYADGALAGRALEVIYTAESCAWIRAAFASVRAGEGPMTGELSLVHRDGRLLRTLCRAAGEPAGFRRLTLFKTELGLLGAALDRLHEENRLLRRIVDAATEGHWCIEFAEPVDTSLPVDDIVHRVFTSQSCWRVCNRAMSVLYGLPEDVDVHARNVRLNWPRSPANEAFVRRIVDSGYCIDGAVSVDRRHDGTAVYVENDVRADIEDGMLLRIWGNCRDVSERRRKEERG